MKVDRKHRDRCRQRAKQGLKIRIEENLVNGSLQIAVACPAEIHSTDNHGYDRAPRSSDKAPALDKEQTEHNVEHAGNQRRINPGPHNTPANEDEECRRSHLRKEIADYEQRKRESDESEARPEPDGHQIFC